MLRKFYFFSVFMCLSIYTFILFGLKCHSRQLFQNIWMFWGNLGVKNGPKTLSSKGVPTNQLPIFRTESIKMALFMYELRRKTLVQSIHSPKLLFLWIFILIMVGFRGEGGFWPEGVFWCLACSIPLNGVFLILVINTRRGTSNFN